MRALLIYSRALGAPRSRVFLLDASSPTFPLTFFPNPSCRGNRHVHFSNTPLDIIPDHEWSIMLHPTESRPAQIIRANMMHTFVSAVPVGRSLSETDLWIVNRLLLLGGTPRHACWKGPPPVWAPLSDDARGRTRFGVEIWDGCERYLVSGPSEHLRQCRPNDLCT